MKRRRNSIEAHSAPGRRRRSPLARLFLTPGEPRLRSGCRLLGHFALLLAVILVFGAPLYLAAALAAPLGFLANEHLLTLLAVTASVYLARRWLDRRSFASLGLRWGGQARRDLLVGAAIPAAQMGLVFLLEWSFGWLEFEGAAWELQPAGLVFGQAAVWLAIFLAVGWYEELLARGYWLQNLAEGLNVPWAVAISSSLFALGHLFNPGASLISILGLAAAGAFLAYGYLRAGSLWLPIGLHIGWNFFEGPVFGFPVSGLGTFRLLRHSVGGPELFTGGVFGPEAGLVALPALALGAALVYGYTRRRKPEVPQGE